MTQAETYYRQVYSLSVKEFPSLGESDMDTIKLMEDFAKVYKKSKPKKKVPISPALCFTYRRANEIASKFLLTLEQREMDKVTPSIFDKWMMCIEKCVRLDKYTYEEVDDVLSWTRQHDFWSVNVQSPLKLRKRDNNDILYITRLLNEMCADKGGSKIAKVVESAKTLQDVSFAKNRVR